MKLRNGEYLRPIQGVIGEKRHCFVCGGKRSVTTVTGDLSLYRPASKTNSTVFLLRSEQVLLSFWHFQSATGQLPPPPRLDEYQLIAAIKATPTKSLRACVHGCYGNTTEILHWTLHLMTGPTEPSFRYAVVASADLPQDHQEKPIKRKTPVSEPPRILSDMLWVPETEAS